MNTEKERKDLLKKFYDSFVEHTGGTIKCVRHDRGSAQGGWFELQFQHHLNCDDLQKIGDFVRLKFTEPGKFTHLAPKLMATRNGIALCVQDSSVQKLAEGEKFKAVYLHV